MFLLRSAVLLFLLYSVSASFIGDPRIDIKVCNMACKTVDRSNSSTCECLSSDMPPDLSELDLEILLDSPVYLAERVFRDLDSDIPPLRKLKHSGVRVTIQEPRLDDQVWIIHKGDGRGRDSNTEVVAARRTIGPWTVEKSRNFNGTKTVRQLRDAGGAKYHWSDDNCHHASERMFSL